MTDDEMRVKIAEIVGPWTFTPEDDYFVIKQDGWVKMRYYPNQPDDIGIRLNLAGVPDYLNDLDAMREAILSLDAPQSRAFVFELEKAVRNSTPDNEGRWWEFHTMNATARQRAQAFIATIGRKEGV